MFKHKSFSTEIIPLEEWMIDYENGCFNQYDGFGYFGNATHHGDDNDVFGLVPVNATHVHWFSK